MLALGCLLIVLLSSWLLATMIFDTKVHFVIQGEHIQTNHPYSLPGIWWCINLSFGYVCWNLRHVEQLFIWVSVSAFMPIQQMDLHASSLIFLTPILLLSTSLTACFCSSLGIMIHLPFSIMPYITTVWSLNVQYSLISCGTLFLLSEQLFYDVLS